MAKTIQLTGIDFIEYMMSRFGKTLCEAMQLARDTDQLSIAQRQQRSNIRNAYIIEDVAVIKAGMDQQDEFGKLCLQEMIDTCEAQDVPNFGLTS